MCSFHSTTESNQILIHKINENRFVIMQVNGDCHSVRTVSSLFVLVFVLLVLEVALYRRPGPIQVFIPCIHTCQSKNFVT